MLLYENLLYNKKQSNLFALFKFIKQKTDMCGLNSKDDKQQIYFEL